MKQILYLIHGESTLIKKHFYLLGNDYFDCVFSTYDKKIEGAFYFQDSTWGEGRNALLKKALELDDYYEYYAFVNDDIEFLSGDFELFAKQLMIYKPAVAAPIIQHKNIDSIIELKISTSFKLKIFPRFQVTKFSDGQFLAFHKNVIDDNLVIPIQTQYDNISWWFSSSTQQLLIFNFYGKRFIQFNNIVTVNGYHRAYPKKEFQKLQDEWFSKEFQVPIKDNRKYRYNILSIKNLKYIYTLNNKKVPFGYFVTFFVIVWQTIFYNKRRYYKLSLKKVRSYLSPSSEILGNYLKKRNKTLFSQNP